MPDRDRVQAFVAAVEAGRYVEAIEDFYHPDASMQDNQGEVRTVLWLFLVAMVIDGSDGILARHFRVKEVVPQIDGALLVSTTTTGLALVSLNRPSMNGNDVEGS